MSQRARHGVYSGASVRVRGACGEGIQGGYGTGWVVGGVYRYPATLLEEGPCSSEAGPVAPAGGRSGWEHGAGRALQHGPPCGPGRSPAVPSLSMPPLSSQNQVQTVKTSELRLFYRLLVKTTKCHRNMSIRPTIVPILKTAIKSHLLIFSDFRFSQPSLTRN